MRRLLPGLALALLAASTAAVVLAATVDVRVGSYYFEDATVGDGQITAKVGDQLRFKVEDSGKDGKPHSVVIDALGINSGSLRKGSTYVTPVLTTPGTFLLYCKFHVTSQGHSTKLVVTGTAATPAPTKTPAPTPAPTKTPAKTAAPTKAPAKTAAPANAATSTPTSTATTSTEPGAAAPTEPGATTSAETAGPSESPGSGAILPVGVGGEPNALWYRSVLVGLAAGIPLLVLVIFAARRSARRSR